MSIPTWLTKSLRVPIIRYLIGIVALLVFLLIFYIKRAAQYRRRMQLAVAKGKIEKAYQREREVLRKVNKHKVGQLTKHRNAQVVDLEKKREEIRAAEKEGSAAVATLVNQAFGKRK